jgi:hypothetical protein
MNLRHSLLQTGAVWCNLEAACQETDYQTCRIILPGALCFGAASHPLRASVYSEGSGPSSECNGDVFAN